MRIIKYNTEICDKLSVLVKEKSVNYKTESNKLDTPEKIVNMLNDVFRLKYQAEEHVYLLCMNSKLHLIGVFEVSHGTANCSLCEPREIFVKALSCGAIHIVVAHNHPSGDETPSREDVVSAKRIKDAGELIGCKVIDNLIIGDGYYSFERR